MIGNAAAIRGTVGDQEAHADDSRPPAERPSDLGGDPPLPIERPVEFPDVHDFRLDLNDQERAGRCMPSDDVDDAAIRIERERDFGPSDPPWHRGQPPEGKLGQRGMTRVDNSIEVSVAGARQQLQSNVKGAGDRSQRGDRQFVDPSELDARHGRLRDTGGLGEVSLPQPAADPSEAKDRPEPNVVHPPKW